MKKKFLLTEKELNKNKWEYLAIFAVLIFYISQIFIFPVQGQMCQAIGFDYCAFWSAGKLSREQNMENIYNLELLKQIQVEFFQHEQDPLTVFSGAPVAYLPIFVTPFTLLSLLNLPLSFLLWILFNFIVFVLYLKFFTRKLFDFPLPNSLLLIFMLTLPVFENFREGQVNIWLLVCGGEFIRALLSEKPFKAGLWIGGWLLKPQLLILIIPFLLPQRKWKALTGFLISSLIIFGLSISIVGMDGMFALTKLILDYSSGLASNTISAMMNWRMSSWYLTPITSSNVSWVIILIGMITTAMVPMIVYNRKKILDSNHLVIALLGIFSATLAVTWHAHPHMAVILIPPMLFLLLKKQIEKKLFLLWVFIPVLMRFISYIILIFVESVNASINSGDVVRFLTGFPAFVLNLALLGWAIHQFKANKFEAQERIIGRSNNLG